MGSATGEPDDEGDDDGEWAGDGSEEGMESEAEMVDDPVVLPEDRGDLSKPHIVQLHP